MNNDEIMQNLDRIVDGYLCARNPHGELLHEKYSQSFVYTMVQKHLFDLESLFDKLDIFDFLSSMLKFTAHHVDETIFVIIQLIDFFKSICEEQQSNQIKFSDLSTYLCRYNPNITITAIVQQEFPPKRTFRKQTQRQVRSIDLNAPVVYCTNGLLIKRINRDKIHIDAQKNCNSPIVKVQSQEKLLKVIVLHQYSEYLGIYNPDCSLDRQLRPRAPQLKNIIHDFCWSEATQRLCLVFKDAFISFYDNNDVSLEKFFSTRVDQLKVYYIQDNWMTVSADMKVSCWDLETETAQVLNHETLNKIVSIVEITHQGLVCIACVDKMTLWDLWDMSKPKLLFKLQVAHAKLQNLIYFETYHMILTSGFDNRVGIYQLHKKYNDGDIVGQLEGHSSIITAIQCVEKSPIVITCDDKHIVKCWDIRILKCIQSFDLELRQSIGCIAILYDLQAVCLATARIQIMNFEGNNQKLEKPKVNHITLKKFYAIDVELDSGKKRLIIATQKDIRIVNLLTGQTISILKVMMASQDDEITALRSVQQHKRLLVSTNKGYLKTFDTENGELISEQQEHQNKITSIHIDYQNRLLISASLDGTLKILKEAQTYESLRKVENVHNGIDDCLYYQNLGLIITGGFNQVCIWEFEFAKLLYIIDCQPKGIHMHNSLLVVGGNETYIFKLSFDNDELKIEQFGQLSAFNKFTSAPNQLFCGNVNGKIGYIALKDSEKKTRQFNCYRQGWEDYNHAVGGAKVKQLIIQEQKLMTMDCVKEIHQKRITFLNFVLLEGHNTLQNGTTRLISCSKDGNLKIMDLTLKIMCSLNINHPLPVQWEVSINEREILKFKIAFCFKLIHMIRQQPSQSMSQLRMLDSRTLLKNLMVHTNPEPLKQPAVELLQEYYEPRDLVPDHLKKPEIISLKQIEEKRKIHTYQQIWKSASSSVQPQETQRQLDEKQKEFKNIQQFLNPNFRNKMIRNEIELIDRQQFREEFEQKLFQVLHKDEINQSKHYSRQSQAPRCTSRLRQSDQTAFFQYASDKRLAPLSTDVSGRTTQRESERSSMIIGSLISDLSQQDKKKVTLQLGENFMRKTSGQLFHAIVQKIDQKLQYSRHKKIRIKGSWDQGIDSNLQSLTSRKQ